MGHKLIRGCGILLTAGSLAAQLPAGAPVEISQLQLDRAAQLLESEIASGKLGAAAILVARKSRVLLHRGFGRLSSAPDAPAVRPDSVFLVASITKPVTAASLMLLVEQGRVSLTDPVQRYLPEFQGSERERVLVRDLLSHTSGLPDMLPENLELRRAHAPLDAFVRGVYKTPLLFPPGSQFRYQSMGVLLAATIVEKVSGVKLRAFEKQNIFDPLGMKNSSLGLGGRRLEDLVGEMTPAGANAADEERFGPNTQYWRDLGVPWGGMHTTTGDLAILLQTFLNGGEYNGRRVFSPATVRAMTTDQNEAVRAPWGIGWALGRSKVWNAFGDLVSPVAFGHAGATGAVAWADPRTELVCVVLTNRPYAIDGGRLLRLVSNAVAASVLK